MGKEIPNQKTENYNMMRKMTAGEVTALLEHFNLRDEHPEYIVIHYPKKTVYIHKWTQIPHAQNDSSDPLHPHYVLIGTDDVAKVVARELELARGIIRKVPDNSDNIDKKESIV